MRHLRHFSRGFRGLCDGCARGLVELIEECRDVRVPLPPSYRRGGAIRLPDRIIGGIALSHGHELVTGNACRFQYIQQLGDPLTPVNPRG